MHQLDEIKLILLRFFSFIHVVSLFQIVNNNIVVKLRIYSIHFKYSNG